MTKRLTDAEIGRIYKESFPQYGVRNITIDATTFARAIESVVLERSKQVEPVVSMTVECVTKWQDELRANHPNSDPQYWSDELMFKYCRREVDALRAKLAAPQAAQINQQLLEAAKRIRHWAEADKVNYTGDHPVALLRAAIAAAEGEAE